MRRALVDSGVAVLIVQVLLPAAHDLYRRRIRHRQVATESRVSSFLKFLIDRREYKYKYRLLDPVFDLLGPLHIYVQKDIIPRALFFNLERRSPV